MKNRPPTQSAMMFKILPLLLILERNLSLSFSPSTNKAHLNLQRPHPQRKKIQYDTPYLSSLKTTRPVTRKSQQQLHQLHMSSLTKILDFVPTSKPCKDVITPNGEQNILGPLDYVKDLVGVATKAIEANKNGSRKTLLWPVSSGQKQLGLLERIGKAIYEEAAPWVTTMVLAMIPSIAFKSSLPILIAFVAEAFFCLYCTFKSITKFNVPKLPEPILRDDWEELASLVWSSQKTIDGKRKFLMGWFYDAPYEKLRKEDAISYLAWMKHGVIYEKGMLTREQEYTIENFDLPLLLKSLNYGKPLQLRKANEEVLPIIRFNCEPLRYRHKGLIFYAVTHGIDLFLHKILREKSFNYVPAKDSRKDLSYWYREPNNHDSKSSNPPLVFVHGVGGMGFCYKLIEDLLHIDTIKEDTPIILIDLPHVSLRLYDDIPTIEAQIEHVSKIIEEHSAVDHGTNGSKKATFVGHSFGTLLLSWMVQKKPESVAGCLFLDPVCFNLHLKDILFNFHMQRVDYDRHAGKHWDNPFTVGSLRNLAGTEMHTNYAMLRQFSWASNSLWPVDLHKNNIPATVVLTEKDDIVPTVAVQELFSEFNNKNKYTSAQCTEVKVFEDAAHGEMFFIDSLRVETTGMILDLIKNNQDDQSSNMDSISLIKKKYDVLLHETGEFWDQISYRLPTRAAGDHQRETFEQIL